MNDSKSVLTSKTFWLAALTFIGAVINLALQQDWGSAGSIASYLLIAKSIVDVGLRLVTDKPVHIIALLLALFVGSTASAACRHLTPMPTSYPHDGAVILGTMSGEVDSFWSTPITVRYSNYDWPADNATGICGGKGWRCWASFARGTDTWTIHRAWQPAPLLFDRHTGSKLP